MKRTVLNESAQVLLSKEEVANLSVKAQNGDERALNRMLESNMGLVYKLANKYKSLIVGKSSEYDDLLQTGTEGLWSAVMHFDASSGAIFYPFAYRTVDGYMKDYLSEYIRSIRLPKERFQKVAKINALMDSYSDSLTYDEKLEKAASDLGRTVAYIKKQLDFASGDFSLPVSKNDMDEDESDKSMAMASKDPNPAEDFRRKLTIALVREALTTLKTRQREVIELSFGLGAEPEELNNADIARRLECTRENVRVLKMKAMEQIRRHMEGA